VQAWTIASGFTNRSVSTAFGQTATTPADDQYATPALGWGTNVAALGIMGALRWELGADLRDDQGQSKEFYNYSSTLDVFQDARRSGGQSIVAGLYGEGAYDLGPWLFTLGARGDNWSTSQGHLLQTVVSGGALIADKTYAARSDTVPTGRAGVRRDFDDGEYLRVSAYEGFRAPTLNELYRPFRVGNVVTEANPALNPEKLGGVDVGWGGTLGTFSWDATGFWNDLHDAVDNVTVPLTVCPPFPPNTPGAACQMKQNIANIDAVGLEGDVAERLSDALSLRAAVSWTDARLRPGAADPLADGKRPAEAPPATITAGADWSPLTPLTLSAQLRWVAREYQDDLNTISLGSALTVDIGAAWQLRDHLSVFGRIENLANATVATAYTTGVYNVAAPRTFEFGVTYAN